MLVPSLLAAIGIGLAFVPATISAVAGVAPQRGRPGLRAGQHRAAVRRRAGPRRSWPPSPPRAPTRDCTTSATRRTPRSPAASSSRSWSPAAFALVGGLVGARSGCRARPRRPAVAGPPAMAAGRVGIATASSVTMRRAVARCFVTRDLPGPALDRLRERARGRRLARARCRRPTTSCARAPREAEGLLSLLTDRVDAALLDRCAAAAGDRQLRGRLRQHRPRRGRGARASPSATRPTCSPTPPPTSPFALLLAAARRLPEARAAVQRRRLGTWEPARYLGARRARRDARDHRLGAHRPGGRPPRRGLRHDRAPHRLDGGVPLLTAARALGLRLAALPAHARDPPPDRRRRAGAR